MLVYEQSSKLTASEADRSLLCRKSGRILALVVGLIGSIVALGWIVNFDFVKSVFPDMPTMKFNTAFCFVLTSCACVLQYKDEFSTRIKSIARLMAGTIFTISFLTLLQHWFNFELGIDQLIVADTLTPAAQAPGRMSLGTSIAFLLVASALLSLDFESVGNHCPAQYLVILSTLLSAAALLGYLYGATAFRLQLFATMALNTALLFVLSGFAVLLIRPNQGLSRLFISDRIGGRAARILLPMIFVVPILGWLSFLGYDSGIYSIEFAYSVFSLLSIITLLLIGWFGASALNDAESYFMSTFESAPTAMIVVDGNGVINRVNSLAEKFFGYARQELIGNKIEMLIPKKYSGSHPQLRQEFKAHPEARQMGKERDLFGLRKDGSEFPVEVGLNPITTPSGMHVLSAITDISQRKRHEVDLQTRTDELARSNSDLEQFAYLASHDLQEPLRAISGSVQLLQSRYKEKLDEKALQYINHAKDGATRMHTLIEDLLTYARVGRAEEILQPINLNDAVESATKNLASTITDTNARIECVQLPTVPGYRSQIALLFQNIIGNAIKFRKNDSQPVIQITSKELPEHWEIRISDNGIGIADQFHQRVFEIFQRLHTRSTYEGTGIGLAICKKVVDHHNGSIGIKPDSAAGATFFFTLKKD